jgi:hypothetical protein
MNGDTNWIVFTTFDDGDAVWNGNGWTPCPVGLDHLAPAEVHLMEPDEAQSCADAFHLCSDGVMFNHEKARASCANSKFKVLEFHTGEQYEPRPLVKNKFIFAREKA